MRGTRLALTLEAMARLVGLVVSARPGGAALEPLQRALPALDPNTCARLAHWLEHDPVRAYRRARSWDLAPALDALRRTVP